MLPVLKRRVYHPMIAQGMDRSIRQCREKFPAWGDCYYIKGCNGSGKSTVPTVLASLDLDAYVLVSNGKILLTVFPNFNIIAAGKYDASKSKGVDSLNDTEQMMQAIEVSEQPEWLGYDLIFEGIIPATILHTWVERLDASQRNLYTLFIDTDMQTCVDRVVGRNGGADFDRGLVEEKWKRIMSHQTRHKELFPKVRAGIIKSQGKTIEEVVAAFLSRDFGELP